MLRREWTCLLPATQPNKHFHTKASRKKFFLAIGGICSVYCGRKSLIHNSLKIVCPKCVFLSWKNHSEVGIMNIPLPLRKYIQILVIVSIKCWSWRPISTVQHITTLTCAFSYSLCCRVQVSARELWIDNNGKTNKPPASIVVQIKLHYQEFRTLKSFCYSEITLKIILLLEIRVGKDIRKCESFIFIVRETRSREKEVTCLTMKGKLRFPASQSSVSLLLARAQLPLDSVPEMT